MTGRMLRDCLIPLADSASCGCTMPATLKIHPFYAHVIHIGLRISLALMHQCARAAALPHAPWIMIIVMAKNQARGGVAPRAPPPGPEALDPKGVQGSRCASVPIPGWRHASTAKCVSEYR